MPETASAAATAAPRRLIPTEVAPVTRSTGVSSASEARGYVEGEGIAGLEGGLEKAAVRVGHLSLTKDTTVRSVEKATEREVGVGVWWYVFVVCRRVCASVLCLNYVFVCFHLTLVLSGRLSMHGVQ